MYWNLWRDKLRSFRREPDSLDYVELTLALEEAVAKKQLTEDEVNRIVRLVQKRFSPPEARIEQIRSDVLATIEQARTHGIERARIKGKLPESETALEPWIAFWILMMMLAAALWFIATA